MFYVELLHNGTAQIRRTPSPQISFVIETKRTEARKGMETKKEKERKSEQRHIATCVRYYMIE